MKTLLAKLRLINQNSLFLSVGYILFHIGREDKLVKENRKSLQILQVSSFIWNLFKIYKLEVIWSPSSSVFFFFVLTDINNANTLFIKIGSVLYAYIKSGTSHLRICFMLLTTLWENEMSFLQSVDAKLRQTSNNCPGNIHSECKNQNMGSLPSDHLSNVLTCCTILSLKYWSVVVSSVTTNRR